MHQEKEVDFGHARFERTTLKRKLNNAEYPNIMGYRISFHIGMQFLSAYIGIATPCMHAGLLTMDFDTACP